MVQNKSGAARWTRAVALGACMFALPREARATWSIIAVDRATGQIGIAAASCTNNVQGIGSIVPGKGVVVVQAMSNNDARARATELLKAGAAPEDIVRGIRDPRFDPENQQYGVVVLPDGHSPATYSGTAISGWSGARTADGVSVQGNILVSERVVTAVLDAFQREPARPLAERLVDALAAGAAAGGDRRCGSQQATSAYVTVYNRDDADGAPYVHVAVYGIEREGQPAVATLVAAFDRWRRESSHQRSTRLYFIP
jgi:uncharacterized Ntn-hydrolase superfamily protein